MPHDAKDKVGLICDVAELAAMFEQTTRLEDFLDQVVRTVAYHMKAAVCSIYLYDENSEELVLAANRGLKAGVGQVRLKPGEGIIGHAFAEQKALNVGQALASPHYKFIPDIDEEFYQAFLVAPIIHGLSRIGVLVVQDPQLDSFDDNDTMAIRAISAQLATTIESAKLLLRLQQNTEKPVTLETPKPAATDMLLVHATPVADGIVQGDITLVNSISTAILQREQVDQQHYTEEHFNAALERTEKQLEAIHYELESHHADIASLIFSAHLLILKSSSFVAAIRDHIRQGMSPDMAIATIVEHYVQIFSAEEDIRFREKALDVQDLGHRLLMNLTQKESAEADYANNIIVAEGLVPSDILRFSTQRALALILVGGNTASHVSILARALKLPTVILKDNQKIDWRNGDKAVIDARLGTIYIRPTAHVLSEYRRTIAGQKKVSSAVEAVSETTHSQDGTTVELLANINLLSELQTARDYQARGIGLYRSEFPFIVRNEFPSEEEQYRIYRTLMEAMPDKEVVLRTLDIGGDKMLSYLPFTREENPFLGLRAIRFSLRNQSIFAEQLRAMLRSGVDADLKIMFPLISSLDDFLLAQEAVHSCKEQLAQAGVAHNSTPRLGAMVELPSAVELIDELARACDFLCIGTNDLIQYMLAVDRTNIEVASLYLPHHPAILRALNRICTTAEHHGTEVSICGEIASNPTMLPFLLGIGLRKLSLDPDHIPATQSHIGRIDLAAAQQLAQELLQLPTIKAIEDRLGIQASADS